MPRIIGQRERRPIDVYDSYSPTQWTRHCDVRLFGHHQIGQPLLCNLMVPRQIDCCDRTAIILSVRARTNLVDLGPELQQAFGEYAQATQVTLNVGDHPLRHYVLADLLKRSPFSYADQLYQVGEASQPEFEHMNMEQLTEKLYRAYHDGAVGDGPYVDLPAIAKEKWRDVADMARSILRPIHPVIVPVRQNTSVTVSWSSRAAAKLRELMIGNRIAPQPLIWIHLEGVATRDVGC